MDQEQLEIIKRALAREKLARKTAEKILEEKSRELYATSQKIEHLLAEKSSQLQGVFENIVDAYVVMDIYGNILKFNGAATDLFGHDINNENLNVIDLVYKDDLAYAMESFQKLKSNGFFKNYEARIYTKSKEVKWVHINASVVFDKYKNPIAAQGIVRDITEAKRNAKLIKEQKEELDVIVNNSSIGIALTQHGQILRTNAKFQKMLGFSESEFTKYTFKDISFAKDYPTTKDFIEKIKVGEIDNFIITNRYIKKDSTIIWAKTNINAVRDNEGNVKYQVVLVEDITSERETAIILDLVNNLTKSIFGKTDINEIAWEIVNNIAQYLNSDDCVIYLVDHEKGVLEQIAAYGNKINNENKIINKLTIPIGTGVVGSVVKSAKSELIIDTSDDDRYFLDNERRLSEITIPIISNGKVIGVIDSEHKDKNHYTNEHLKTLESIANLVAIKIRTAISIRKREKAEAYNIQLLSELEKSNDELHQYAHIVSHDLKSPLRSIDALLNWLKEDNAGKFDEGSLQNIKLIESTLERMELLISDILDYSRVTSDNSKMTEVNTDILVKELIKFQYIPNHIKLKLNSALPIVKADKTKLQQVFQNLISNAVKFSDKNKGIIEVDAINTSGYYLFSVKDNGIGIEKKHHEKIFKIFHSLKTSKNSTGIGLSIVKKIINLHEGDIWLESEPDKGSTFFFTLKKHK
jgi:PAS domain S-box-containing protein